MSYKFYTCECCEREFNEEEYQLTNDKVKCILHCEKDTWYKIDEKGEKDWTISQNNIKLFWEEFVGEFISFYELSKSLDAILKSDIEYVKIIFPKEGEFRILNYVVFEKSTYSMDEIKFTNYGKIPVSFKKYFSQINIRFDNCKFLDNINFSKIEFSKDIIFKKCTFENNVDFSFILCQSKFKLIDCNIFNKTNFYRAKFNQLAGFEKTTFNQVSFRNTRFNRTARFIGTIFKEKANFNYTYFNDNVFFNNTVIDNEISLDSAIFFKSSSFYGIKCEKVSNRETARIIKDSFEQQNNIIEANKFYALEMKEREKELESDVKKGKNFFEYLIFLFHSISSNHSQNWLLPLFWIIVSTFGYSLLSCYEFSSNFIYGTWISISIILVISIGTFLKNYIDDTFTHTSLIFIFGFLFYLAYGFTNDDFTLNKFSNNINPFSIMTEFSDLTFLTLVYKITIAYLIYQLIISIRQNTRRK